MASVGKWCEQVKGVEISIFTTTVGMFISAVSPHQPRLAVGKWELLSPRLRSTSRVLLLPWVHLCATAATLSQVIYVFNREVGSLGVIQCMSRSFRLGYFDFIHQRHVVSDGIPAWYHVSRRKEFADKPSHSVLPPPPRYPNGSLYTGYPPGVIIETNNTLTHHEGPEYQLVVGEGA